MRRIVITGMGLVSPLGSSVELAWQRLLAGRSGVTRLPEGSLKACPHRSPGVC